MKDGPLSSGPGKSSQKPEASLMMTEPRGIMNTGHEGGDRMATNDVLM